MNALKKWLEERRAHLRLFVRGGEAYCTVIDRHGEEFIGSSDDIEQAIRLAQMGYDTRQAVRERAERRTRP